MPSEPPTCPCSHCPSQSSLGGRGGLWGPRGDAPTTRPRVTLPARAKPSLVPQALLATGPGRRAARTMEEELWRLAVPRRPAPVVGTVFRGPPGGGGLSFGAAEGTVGRGQNDAGKNITGQGVRGPGSCPTLAPPPRVTPSWSLLGTVRSRRWVAWQRERGPPLYPVRDKHRPHPQTHFTGRRLRN